MKKGAPEERIKQKQKLTDKQIKQRQELGELLKLVGLKQEQTLIKYMLYPFWKAMVATMSLLTGILLASGGWGPSAVTIIVVCFGLYTCLKLRARLKLLGFVFHLRAGEKEGGNP